MSQAIIEVRNLYASYNNNTVLQDINLTIRDHDFLGIIGPNGGGKTTLIRCIIGLKHPDKGEIKFFKNGKEVDQLTIGYLPQYTSIDKRFPISVFEVVLSGLSSKKSLITKYTPTEYDKAKTIIKRMGLTGLEERAIGELSGGQLQRAILGRSMISDPDVLILDEPSTYVDKKFEAELYLLLKEIQTECAIVLISHDIVTTLNQVNCIAAVNKRLEYAPNNKVSAQWLERVFECPVALLGFGKLD